MRGNTTAAKIHFKGTKLIGRISHLDITLFPLNGDIAGTFRILGPNGQSKEVRILHLDHATGINAVKTKVSRIVNGFRFPEQANDEIQVVDIDIVKGTTTTLGVKSRQHFTFKIFVIAAGVLGVIGNHGLDFAQFRQSLLDGGKVRQIMQGHSLENI